MREYAPHADFAFNRTRATLNQEQNGGASLRAALRALPGIDDVVIDDEARVAALILRSDVDPNHMGVMARPLVEPAGYTAACVFRPDQRDRQRVRFVGLQRTEVTDMQAEFRVALEWTGQEYRGEATGERGDALELRTVATATLSAISDIVPEQLDIRLAGVKQIRAFDADLVVVSLFRAGAQPHNLVGAVVAGEDSRRAAAFAVLAAMNRLLGNYLVT
jgi:hypothetical protein